MTLKTITEAVWGTPTVVLILAVGIYYTLSLGLPQLRLFRLLKRIKPSTEGHALTPLQSLSTSLAATVGTGSIIGVATAITIGGAGAVFWLWVSAFFGMAVAYAEGFLAIKYRRSTKEGYKGGIWYALEIGLKSPKTAKVYALLTVLTSFGMGCMAQTNSAADALFTEFRLPKLWCGILAAALLGVCLRKGGRFAGKLCERAIPLLAGLYVLGAAAVILWNLPAIPAVFGEILRSAFGIRAAAGGAAGYAVKTAVSVGCRRGIFSNEAGLGTTAAVHASSSVDDPAAQGAMNMLEVVIDTFIICTLTALAILTSGADCSGGAVKGAELVISAAERVFGGFSGALVAVSAAGFALATAVGWSQIGSFAAEYLSGEFAKIYKILFAAAAVIGTVMGLEAVFDISDIFNGLMAIPCMTALILLSREVVQGSRRG